MAKYHNSPFGQILGEQAGVVGSVWKGINYIRKWVTPANPKSTLQTAQRDKFRNISEFGRRIVNSVLNTYWLPKPKKMSPFNDFQGRNVKLQTSGTMDYSLVKTSFGSLTGETIDAATATSGVGAVNVTWTSNLSGEASADDIAVIVGYNVTQDMYSVLTTRVRSDENGILNLNADTGDVIWVWLAMVDAKLTMASESNNLIVTVTT